MLLANGNGTFQGPKQARNRDIVNWCQLSHKFDHGRADRKMIDVRTKIIQGTIWIVVLAACLLGASVPVTCICRAKAGYSGVTERVTRLAACDETSTRSAALIVIAARMGRDLQQPWAWLGIAKKSALNPPSQYCSSDAVCDGSLQRQLQLPAAATPFSP